MINREKVIRAIDGCINIGDYCNDCDYDGCIFHHGSCEKDLLADALTLLKEQEPMVLTADELYLMEHQCVYLERRNSKVYSSEPSIVIGTSKALFCQYKYFLMRENKISDVRYSSDYNKETKSGWRCWSAKPTEEQMKEVPWE